MRLVMVFFCAVLAALHKPCDTAAHEDDGLLHEPPGTGDPNIDIFHAAAAGNIKKVQQLLKQGVSIDRKNEYGESLLHVAALSKRWKMLRTLLTLGGNASAITDGEYEGHATRVHRSVLEWWVVHCAVEPIKLLVNAGADLTFKDEEGQTVLDRAKGSGERCHDVVAYIEKQLDQLAKARPDKEDL